MVQIIFSGYHFLLQNLLLLTIVNATHSKLLRLLSLPGQLKAICGQIYAFKLLTRTVCKITEALDSLAIALYTVRWAARGQIL